MTTQHRQNTIFPVQADHLLFCGNNVGVDGNVSIESQEHTSNIHIVNKLVLENNLNIKDKINDEDGDNVFELTTNDTKVEHNKLTKFNQNIDFNDKEVSNLAGFDGKFTSSQIVSSNRSGQAPPNNTLDKEIDDMLIDIGNNTNRTTGLTTNKIMTSNNSGTLAVGSFGADKIIRNDVATQQEFVGDINLADTKRIKYNGVAIEISSADKLDKDFGNIGSSNILPEANTHSSIARVLALNNGLDLKADKTGVVFTGDVSINTNAITASKPLEVDGNKKIISSSNFLMTQAERDKVGNVPANTTSSLSGKASLSGATFTGDVRLDNLTASKVLVLDGDKDITTDDGLLMTQAERDKVGNVPANTTSSLSGKASLSGATFTGDVRLDNLTASKVLVLDGDKDITTDDGLLMSQAERDKVGNVPSNTTSSLSGKASLSGATFTGDVRLDNLTGNKVLVLDNDKDITTSDDTLLTSAQATAIGNNSTNITTITNNYIKKDGSVDFTSGILAPTLEVGTTGYTITKDGNNDLTLNIPTGEIYNFKINNSLIAKIDSGGIDLGSGKTFAIDGSNLTSTFAPTDSPTFTGDAVFGGKITCGNSNGDGLYFGSDAKPKIHAFNNNLIIECNDSANSIIFKTFQASTTTTTNSFTILDDYAEIDDGYGLRVKNIAVNSFVKTDGDSKLVAGTIALGDLPSGTSKIADAETITGVKTFHGSKLKITGGAVPSDTNFSAGVLGITGSGFVELKLLGDNDLSDNIARVNNETFTGTTNCANLTATGTTNVATLNVSGELDIEGNINLGDGNHAIFFGSDNRPRINAFNNSLFFEAGATNTAIHIKTFQASTTGTTISVSFNDDEMVIDDGYKLRLNNCDANEILSTNGSNDIVSNATIALSNMPSTQPTWTALTIPSGFTTPKTVGSSDSSFTPYPALASSYIGNKVYLRGEIGYTNNNTDFSNSGIHIATLPNSQIPTFNKTWAISQGSSFGEIGSGTILLYGSNYDDGMGTTLKGKLYYFARGISENRIQLPAHCFYFLD